MLARVPALVALAAWLLSSRADAQARPAERGRPTAQAPRRSWRVPLGAGVSYAVPAGSISRDLALSDAFGSGPTVRLDAGLAYRLVGASLVWRRGFVSAGSQWCPVGAACSARFDAMGAAVTLSPRWDEAFSPFLMLGAALDQGEVRWSGSFRRATGRELFASLFMGPRLGSAASPWRIGGYLDLRAVQLDRVETPAGRAAIPASSPGRALWFELGVRASFD